MVTKYIKKTWWRYVIGLTSLVISVALDVWFPLITMAIVDDVIIGGEMDLLWKYLSQILMVGFGRMVFQYAKEFSCDMAGCNVAEELRLDLMRHLRGLSKSFFDRSNTGELMARVKDDGAKIWDAFGFVGMLFIEATVYLFGVIFCMLRLSISLSLIPIAFLPILGFMVIRLEKKLDELYGEISEENAELTRVAEENISGVRTVKAFAREKYEINKFDVKNEGFRSLNKQQEELLARTEPFISLIPRLMQILVLIVGGYYAINGKITYGLLVAFFQYATNIVWPIENMGWMINMLASAAASYRKIQGLFAETPDIVGGDKKLNAAELVFDKVGFSIGDKQILKDISFELAQGKTLGIMGETGSGKSSIVNLLERLYDVTEGEIRIGGTNIKELELEELRKYSVVVPQEVFLFSDTIAENVKLGLKKTMTDSEVHEALEKAHAAEFVDKLADGQNAVIGERGIGLSGGQKQRLSLARALSRKASLLVLDDSTSALDMETELEIQAKLRKLKDTSKIIVAHRISSVKDADEIIVLKDGQIAERGTHDELIAMKGIYYSTYEAQYGDYHRATVV